MHIVISSGHGLKVRGAAGPPPWGLDEVNEARRVTEQVAAYLRTVGVKVDTFHDDTSTDQSTNLSTIVAYHNSIPNHELDVSIHFNAYQVTTTKEMGCECLFVTQQTLAELVADKLSEATDLPNRGAKYRDDLYFLGNTRAPAILVETVFCDAKPDCDSYRQNFNAVAAAIAEAVSGRTIDENPVEPPVDPDPPPVEQPPAGEQSTVVITSTGPVLITVNGEIVTGPGRRRKA